MTIRKCDRGGCTSTGDEATFAYIEAPGIFDRPRWYCPDCAAAFRKLLAESGRELVGIDKLDGEGNVTGREPIQ